MTNAEKNIIFTTMASGTDEILEEIEAFLRRTGMAPTPFGLQSCGDGHVVFKLRRGEGMSMRRAKQIREFMAAFDAASGPLTQFA